MKKIKLEIKNRWTGNVLFEYETEDNTIKKALEKAVKSGADLSRADLSGADLSRADLSGADLNGADLSEANLSRADLSEADLSEADLSEADLSEANLSRADLRWANLSGAYLSKADLIEADLREANLSESELIRRGLITKKSMTVYKKASGHIVTLQIPKGSIIFSINNYKCRTNKAKVISIDNDTTKGAKVSSGYDSNFIYEVGKTITIDDFDLMYNVECSTGIHFFRTKKEAEEFEW